MLDCQYDIIVFIYFPLINGPVSNIFFYIEDSFELLFTFWDQFTTSKFMRSFKGFFLNIFKEHILFLDFQIGTLQIKNNLILLNTLNLYKIIF